jgi:hypothetical protein
LLSNSIGVGLLWPPILMILGVMTKETQKLINLVDEELNIGPKGLH